MKIMFTNLLGKKAQEIFNCKTFYFLPSISIGWSQDGVSIEISFLIFNILMYNTKNGEIENYDT